MYNVFKLIMYVVLLVLSVLTFLIAVDFIQPGIWFLPLSVKSPVLLLLLTVGMTWPWKKE